MQVTNLNYKKEYPVTCCASDENIRMLLVSLFYTVVQSVTGKTELYEFLNLMIWVKTSGF
jgi:hypothetical protein